MGETLTARRSSNPRACARGCEANEAMSMRVHCLLAGLLMTVIQARAAEKPALAAEPFPLSAVRLLPNPFKAAMEADQKYLTSLDPDRLLAGFRANAGLPEKAKVYGGWESRGISGQTLGHYLSACAMMYAATGEERFRERVKYCVGELKECQDAVPDGFLGGMPRGREMFAEIARGDIRVKGGFDLNGGWVPWYNQAQTFRRPARRRSLRGRRAREGRPHQARRLGRRRMCEAHRRADAGHALHRARRHE